VRNGWSPDGPIRQTVEPPTVHTKFGSLFVKHGPDPPRPASAT